MHQYRCDEQSGAGNCTCGAQEAHRTHWHDFRSSLSYEHSCICGKPRSADCHASQLSRDMVTVTMAEIRARQAREPVAAYTEADAARCGHSGGMGLRSDHLCRCLRAAAHAIVEAFPHRCICGTAWSDAGEPMPPERQPVAPRSASHDFAQSLTDPLRCLCGSEREDPRHRHAMTHEDVREVIQTLAETYRAPEPVPAYTRSDEMSCGHSGGIGLNTQHMCRCNRGAVHPIDSLQPHTCDCGTSWPDNFDPSYRSSDDDDIDEVEQFEEQVAEIDPAAAVPEDCGHSGGIGLRSNHMCRCNRGALHPIDSLKPHTCDCGTSWPDADSYLAEERNAEPVEEIELIETESPVVVEPVIRACGHSGGMGLRSTHVCQCTRGAMHPLDSDRPHTCKCGTSWPDAEKFVDDVLESRAVLAGSVVDPLADFIEEKLPPLPESEPVSDECGHSGGVGLNAAHMCKCNRGALHPIDSPRPHTCNCGTLWPDVFEHEGWEGDLARPASQE